MSYPSQKRRLRPARGVAAAVAALMAAGAGLAALPSAFAVPSPSGPAGNIQTMAGMTVAFRQGGPGTDNVPATQSQWNNPRGLNFDGKGNVYVTDAINNQVRMIDNAGVVHLIAGTGAVGYTGDGGQAKSATLSQPHGVAVDSAGNVYIADSSNCVIREVDGSGNISTIAGNGVKDAVTGNCKHTPGQADGPPKTIGLDQPKSIFMTKENGVDTLYIADMGNSMIRKINVGAATPIMTRVAGTIQSKLYGGDNGPANMANLRHAEGVWVANDGTVYITDGGNNLVRKIANDAQHTITTIAGDVAAAQAAATTSGQELTQHNDDGDGGPALSAHLDEPRGITGDNNGHLYVAEENGSRIRRIDLDANGNSTTINTIAGDGHPADQRSNGGSYIIPGENGPALQTEFNHLHDIEVNPADGSLWIADSRNDRVRAIADVANAPLGQVPTATTTTPPPSGCTSNCTPVPAPSGKSGYWMLGNDGKVYAFGDAKNLTFGDASGRIPAGAKAVHIEPTPDAGGYWINDDRGGVYAFGNANSTLGGVDPSALQGGEKVTSLSSTPSGQGYWIFTSKGRVFAKGDAHNFGDLGALTLNGPILDSIPTPSGQGYYMVGSDGGVFAFGDAKFMGPMGGQHLNKPVEALVPTRDGAGYWLVASDGGIFAFGQAPFRGSMGSTPLNKPVVGMVRYGDGYLMVGADGGIFDFSSKPFQGSLGSNPPAHPIVFAATLDS
jgi:sugar lactone lactonase YvrE